MFEYNDFWLKIVCSFAAFGFVMMLFIIIGLVTGTLHITEVNP